MINISELRSMVNATQFESFANSVINSLLDRLEEVEKENIKLREALAEKVISETVLRNLSVGNGSINASFEGGAVHLFVDSLANQFVESGAVNYLEMRFHSEATGPLLLTLQRADGKTPHQLRVEAEQERDALLAALQHETDCLEAAKAKIDALHAEIAEIEKQEPSVPDGWLRAINEALVTAYIGVANAHDTYEQAKAKLDNLCDTYA